MIRALAVAVGLTAMAAPATAAPGASLTTATVQSKKDQFLAKKREQAARSPAQRARARALWERKLSRRIGKKPVKLINIFNGWTHEDIAVPAGKRGDPPHQDAVEEFLRCRFTNKTTRMDPKLLPTVIEAAKHFNADRVVVVSGYRSPKYNLILQKKGRHVSRRSQHMRGKAIDFRLDGVSSKRLHAWAKALGMGGVGYYGPSSFIHIDTGPVRYWNGK